MGLVNGNQGVVASCLGEITDRSNQTSAFKWLPVIYGLGGIIGPAFGGLLVFKDNPFKKGEKNPYPYLLVNIFSATVLLVDLALTGFFLEESLDDAKNLPPLKKRISNLFSRFWEFTSGDHRRVYSHSNLVASPGSHSSVENEDERQFLMPDSTETAHANRKHILKRSTIILLVTYLIFQLSNISFNTLYPVFGSSSEPTGRKLNPEEIGLSLAFAGLVMILFQVTLFSTIKEKMGNKASYRASLLLLALSMFMMPFLGHRDAKPPLGVWNGKVWLWIELGFVLLIKTVASVIGLTSAMLLVSQILIQRVSSPTNANSVFRSQTHAPTTLSLEKSMALHKPCRQPAELSVPFSRAASSVSLLVYDQRGNC
jgi:hypothetical protein